MNIFINPANIVSAVVFALIGLIVFVIGFWGIDKFTPYHLWKELIEERNIALAIVVAGTSIGICTIIAAAIHG